MSYYIDTLRIQCFKSVGFPPIEVHFERGLNAIVGPNGAGKSSILEAISFAFASPMHSLGVGLGDIRNTSAGEVCEVRVTLKKGFPSGEGPATVVVSAVLTPEGTRAYRILGKNSSGIEVQKKLRLLGVNVGSPSSLIKQDAITQLADTPDDRLLSSVVSESSGHGLWNQQTALAYSEIKRHEQDAERISRCIEHLSAQGSAAQEEIQRAEQALLLEEELSKETTASKATLANAMRELNCASLQSADAKGVALTTEHRLERLLGQTRTRLEELEARLTVRDQHPETAAGIQDHDLNIERSVIEEELEMLRNSIEKQAAAAAALVAAQQEQRAATKAYAAAHTELKTLEHLYLQMRNALGGAEEEEQAHLEIHETFSCRSIEAQKFALQKAEERLKAETCSLVAAQRAVEDLKRSQNEEMECEKSIVLDGHVCHMTLQQAEAHLIALDKEISELHWKEHSTKHGSVAASRTLPLSGLALPAGMAPLHQLFHFKNPGECAQHSTALEVMAGTRLNIIVAQTAEDAAKFSSSCQGERLRFWPLDLLTPRDHLKQQRRGAANFPPGEVIIPLDLLNFDVSHRPALLRAFGSHVITATPQVSEILMEKFGVPSVCVDGSVTSRCRLTGGWVSEGKVAGPMRSKLHADLQQQNLYIVHKKLEEALQNASHLKKWISHQEALADAHLQATVTAKQRETEEAKESKAKIRVDEATEDVMRLQRELDVKIALAKAAAGHGDDGHCQASVSAQMNSLQAQIDGLKRHVAHLKGVNDAAAETTRNLKAIIIPSSVRSSWPQRLKNLMLRLADLQHRAEDIAKVSRETAEMATRSGQAEMEQLQSDIMEHQLSLDASREEVHKIDLKCQRLAALQANLDAMKKTIPKDLRSVLCSDGDAEQQEASVDHMEVDSWSDVGHLSCLVSCVKASVERCRSLAAKLASQHGHLRGDRTSDVAHQRSMAIANSNLVNELEKKQQVMRSCVRILQAGIEKTDPLVIRQNEDVFERTRVIFRGLMKNALPALEVDFVRVGTVIHREGARFRYRLANVHMTEEKEQGQMHSGAPEWHEGLEGLSGGQRSLACLAFIIAARMGGNGHNTNSSGVMLVDEVDSALDAENQALAAELLRIACQPSLKRTHSVPRSAQIIAVSHSAEFQGMCDHIVKITRGSQGTVVEGSAIKSASRAKRSNRQV